MTFKTSKEKIPTILPKYILKIFKRENCREKVTKNRTKSIIRLSSVFCYRGRNLTKNQKSILQRQKHILAWVT